MKRLLQNIRKLSGVIGLVALFWGCEKDANFKIYEYPMPQVESISPHAGYVKSQLLIVGTDFGDQIEPVKVFFGGVEAKNILMCKNNRIVVEVPENAVSGEVSLQIWTKTVENIGMFTVLPTPEIKSVTTLNPLGSNVAHAGEEVFIKGSGFGTDPSVVSVRFNGTNAQFTLCDDENITAIAPQGYASGNVSVIINGLEVAGDAILNPDVKGDVTVFYLKNYKLPFKQVEFLPGQAGSGNEAGWFAIPQNWIVNDAAKSMVNRNADASAGKLGGMVKGDLGMQAGWGGSGTSSSITNGKMYQNMTLPAGVYRLEITFSGGNVANDNVFAVVCKGEELPDVENINNSNADIVDYCKFSQNLDEGKGEIKVETLRIDLSEPALLSFGFSVSMGNQRYFRVNDIKLILE